MIRHAHITDAELYLDDNTMFGIAKEFKIPAIEHKTVDHETLGAVAVFEAPARPVQALSGSIKLQFIEKELAARFMNPTKVISFQLHSIVDAFDADGLNAETSHRIVTHVRAMFKKVEFGDAKLGDAQELDGEFSAVYLMQRAYGEETPIVEIDVFGNRFKNSGQDVWPR